MYLFNKLFVISKLVAIFVIFITLRIFFIDYQQSMDHIRLIKKQSDRRIADEYINSCSILLNFVKRQIIKIIYNDLNEKNIQNEIKHLHVIITV